MKAQGITLMTSQTTEVKIKKKTDAQDSTFENFIAKNASGVSKKPQNPNADIAETKSSMEAQSSKVQKSKQSEDGSSSDKTQGKDAVSNGQINNSGTKNVEDKTDVADSQVAKTDDVTEVKAPVSGLVSEDGQIDIEKVNEEIMAILQDVLNLLPQDVQDIFDQIGMQPTDLFTGIQTGEIESFSITTVQVFVMEVHGIEDPSTFLTNDILNQEMNDIFDKMKTLLAEMMRVGVQDIEKMDETVWESFAGDLIKAAHPEIQAEEVVQTQVVADSDEVVPVSDEVVYDTSDDTAKPDMQIVIENRTSSDAGSDTGAQTGQGTGLGTDDVRDAAADLEAMSRHTQTSNAQVFAEALTEAMEPEATQAADVQRQMTEIVEQVVRQVRVRMMPESTNMELQLHPASLGRVNVQVNAAAGETTARLIVENQAAKEALESGMIRLQEIFEERGLKVNAVEVTIGSFDMGLDQQNTAGTDEGNKGNGNRRGSGNSSQDGADAVEATESNQTEASRRDVNSTVDYTA